MQPHAHVHEIHIFVTIGQKPPLRLTFQTEIATGLQIKEKAGFGTNDGLYEREHGDAVEITDETKVELKDGLHFVVIPNGRVS